jgi:membrane-bound lytic murein transglycosylase D
MAGLACLPIVLALVGCAWRGARIPELPDQGEVATVLPDSQQFAVAISGQELPPLLPSESSHALGQIDPQNVDSWHSLYRQALGSLAAGQLAIAQDLLFVLQDWLGRPAPADCDSSALAQRRSLARRLVLLSGLVAEAVAQADSCANADSALAAAYTQLAGAVFPDSLLPLVGEQRRPLVADLLRIDNAAVRKWQNYFTGAGRRHFALWIQRQATVDSLVEGILSAAGLPSELIYLAMIESGLSSHATSSAGAAGPWQFMPGTAKRYGLRVNWWADERRDLELSTRAAAAYLQDLYARFGDWVLVLAAYNAGENRIERAMHVSGHDDFWRLSLPQQTAAYIPKYIAAARLAQQPERFGFQVDAPPSYRYDVVPVDDATDLGVIAQCAGVPTETVIDLNPALLRRASPPDSPQYPVRVPAGTGKRCLQKLRKIPPEQRLTWRRHRIQRGETLSEIAHSYGTSVTAIREVNRLASIHLIHPGDQLLIPIPAQLAAKARQRAREKGHYVPPDGYERVSYVVKAGDTLSGIARKLGVSLTHLRKVNGLQRSSLIHPGQRLYAYRPGRLSATEPVTGGG